ncbi:winged helix-turn-helix domain-containing protein [Maritalea sp. S77]|jgi:DNA-binding winged helix-turn-helix (wHTH) protein|uniref:winged helix-turn-helix domain-containing protein n=1 Tax=Maritalea sp. S77 TaxID=3415125 RepID=UPI003C7A250B
MERSIRLGHLKFDESFFSATCDDGKQVNFTKAETSLLRHFTQHTMRLQSRSQLLDVVSFGSDEKLDRSIDFLINRLRQKLGDNAKTPVFIATRYGEGYIWLAKQTNEQSLAKDCHAVVGPILGLNHIGMERAAALAFSKQFHKNFEKHFDDKLLIEFHPDVQASQTLVSEAPEVGVELSYVLVDGELECVFRGYQFSSDKTLFAKRICVSKSLEPNIETIAEEISGTLRTALAKQAKGHVPLAVGMIEAGKTFTGIKGHWSEGEKSLRKQVEDNPVDYHAKIMLATNIHTKYLQDSVQIFSSNHDPRKSDEDEIEALVTSSLPHLQNQPSFLLPAAKLLYFIDRGYNDMAFKMAERLHKESTSLAASLPVVGQMRVFAGHNTEGQVALDHALELCDPGSQYEVYLLILKCEAMVAVANRHGLDQILEKVCTYVPQIEVLMHVLFTSEEKPSKIAQQALVNMSPAQANGMLMLMHYVYGRLFKNPTHAANAYATPVSLFSRQFGTEIVPEEITRFLKRNSENAEASSRTLAQV